jgi:hypothetical protein
MSLEAPTAYYIHHLDISLAPYSIEGSNHSFSSPKEVNSDRSMRFSSLRISPTPFTDAEYFEGVRSTIEIHLLTDFFLQFFQLPMGKFYDPPAPFTNQVVVMLMAQYMFVVVGTSPKINHFQ